MNKTFVLFFAILISLGISCKKKPEVPTGGNKILIGTTTPDTVSYVFAKISTQLIGTGGNQITQHGHCWSVEANPDTNDEHTSLCSIVVAEKFTSDLSGLSENIVYFIRPYITYQYGTIYGSQKEINTLKRGKPVVITGSTSELTTSSVKISGTASFDSGFAITQKGICWDTVANPTLQKLFGHSEEGAGTGSFISSVTNLTDNKQYYFCAYATNEKGTSYGDIKQFITVSVIKPTVNTIIVTDITNTTATSGGNVTSDGGANVTVKGVCWSTSSNPTTFDNHTADGSGTGSYVSSLTGLTPNTIYYVRAYATNSVGTSYGNEVTFTSAIYYIGHDYGGGIIFYIDGNGQHGLIAATNDQSGGAEWGCDGTLIGGTSSAIGAGQANTTAIVNGCGQVGIAARICDDLVLNGYSDWFLPSKDELNQMYLQKSVIGGFINGNYWSSSENGANYAWYQYFGAGYQYESHKYYPGYVRAIRAF